MCALMVQADGRGEVTGASAITTTHPIALHIIPLAIKTRLVTDGGELFPLRALLSFGHNTESPGGAFGAFTFEVITRDVLKQCDCDVCFVQSFEELGLSECGGEDGRVDGPEAFLH